MLSAQGQSSRPIVYLRDSVLRQPLTELLADGKQTGNS